MKAYSVAVLVLSGLFVLLGAGILVRTGLEGGGVVGYAAGGLFVALGVGRIVLERRRREWAS